LEKSEEFVKRDGHCNSTTIPSFHSFLFADCFSFLFFSPSEIGELLRMWHVHSPQKKEKKKEPKAPVPTGTTSIQPATGWAVAGATYG
jgi:hypothetical protein